MPEAYDSLAPHFRAYVDALIEHARTALWPERRTALESFRRGIAQSRPSELRAAADAMGFDAQPDEAVADLIFRRVLTAYLARLGEGEVTNPDQARLYLLSLDAGHAALAERWRHGHPDAPAGRRFLPIENRRGRDYILGTLVERVLNPAHSTLHNTRVKGGKNHEFQTLT